MKKRIKPKGNSGPPVIGATSHQGASTSSAQLASWVPMAASADADLLPDLGLLTSRSRDLTRNNGIAAAGIQTLVDNVVGVGLRLAAMPDWRALGKSADWAMEWQRKTESLWREWASSTACDAARELNFAGLTELVFRSQILNGDAIAIPLWLARPGERFRTAIQLVESDRLCNPNLAPDTASMRGGIEFDRYGAAAGYWIRTTHPGDVLLAGGSTGKWERIPARTPWGRRRVLHVHEKERTGQSRGKPIWSSSIQQFKMLDRYAGAELDAAVINAIVAAFIETQMDSDALVDMLGGPTAAGHEFTRRRTQRRPQLKSGMVVPLNPGERLAPFQPARPAAQFEAFTVAVMRHIAASIGLPYELLLKDFSKTNYSSARAALLEAWRTFRSRREKLSWYWAQPVYELWLEEAIDAGLIEAPSFYEQRAAWCRASWIGPGRGWVDPVKEAQAAKIRMETGISTLQAECAEQGLDWEEVMEQRAREQAKARELGLTSPAPDDAAPSDKAKEDEGDD
ncbi:Phage portal protein, lambda family [Laribacter hongkongensis HLHK9]|uniref:Phage portal protein, lambda family n=1 Tax=Laribacter hongkongensis (strain HLHK9) TaxID=557598 RepID=C1D854_LARHH|nr:phage portal protein [Laribacter hongkongensis]ACO74644.1 Phage portal protein, lambda family [Laribacter hongkongensis HLHK9]